MHRLDIFKNIKRKAIIITGGNGYLGSHLVLNNKLKNKLILIIDKNLKKKKYNIENRYFFRHDFTNKNLLNSLVKTFKVQTVIHLAAYTSVIDSLKNKKKYYKNNFLKSLQLIRFCKKNKIKNFIFASSAAVYGKVGPKKINETYSCKPVNPYGLYKLNVEKYLKLSNLNYSIIRFFNIAGADLRVRSGITSKNNKSLIHFSSICAVKKKPLSIYGVNFNTRDGSSERDYVHVTDATNVIIRCIDYLNKKKSSLLINCGTGTKTSTLLVVKKLNKLLKINLSVFVKKAKIGEIPSIMSNNKKLRKKLRYKFKYNFDDILRSSIRWVSNLN